MRKLVWWNDFTTDAQDTAIAAAESDEAELDLEFVKDCLQQVAEAAFAAGFKEGKDDARRP